MCGKVSFIVYGQRKEKVWWVFDGFFFFCKGIPRFFLIVQSKSKSKSKSNSTEAL